MIGLPSGTKVWLAAGVTDMRRGFDGLATLIQRSLLEDPFSGHVFVFRGRKGIALKFCGGVVMECVCSQSAWSTGILSGPMRILGLYI